MFTVDAHRGDETHLPKGRTKGQAIAMRVTALRLLMLLSMTALVSEAASPIAGEKWPPSDPQEYSTEVNFTLAWAKRLRGFKTLSDLQRAAKAKGTISQRSLEGDDPYVSFHWRSEPLDGTPDVGYMLATVRPNGKITASILTTDKHEVIVSNTGAFSVEQGM